MHKWDVVEAALDEFTQAASLAKREAEAIEAARYDITRLASAAQLELEAVQATLDDVTQLAKVAQYEMTAMESAYVDLVQLVKHVWPETAEVAKCSQELARMADTARPDFEFLESLRVEVDLRQIAAKSDSSSDSQTAAPPPIEQEYKRCMIGLLEANIKEELPPWLRRNKRLPYLLAVATLEFSDRFTAVTGQLADLRSGGDTSDSSLLSLLPDYDCNWRTDHRR